MRGAILLVFQFGASHCDGDDDDAVAETEEVDVELTLIVDAPGRSLDPDYYRGDPQCCRRCLYLGVLGCVANPY